LLRGMGGKAGSAGAGSKGGALTGGAGMLEGCGALGSTPPLAVPPVSWRTTVPGALPVAPAAGVNVSVPLALMAGPAEKRATLLLLVIWKVTVCHHSLAGPGEMAVAQPPSVCGPEPSRTVASGPLVNVGGWLTGLTVMRN